MSATRPEVVDDHGALHRFGCDTPGWISDGRGVIGWRVVRCAGCGAVRLVRANGGNR